MAGAFAEGATEAGADVVMIGLASTDQLYFASGHLGHPGAMFTASHNPAQYNGIKMCRAYAPPVGMETGLAEIRDLVGRSPRPVAGPTGAHHRARRARGVRRAPAHASPRSTGRRLKVVVDAGNGMAGHTAPAVFGRLGDQVDLVPMYFELDGTFPQPRGQPDRAGQPGRPAGAGARRGRRHRARLRRRRRPLLHRRRARRGRLAVDAHRADRLPRAGQGARRDGDPQPDHQPRGARDRHSSSAARRCAPGSATPTSRPRWPRPTRSSAASTAATSTSATSGAPTPACSPRCTRWPRSPRPTGRCRSCWPSSTATSLSGEINSEVADQAAVIGRDRGDVRRPRRRHDRPPRRAHRQPRRLVVQRPTVQHRAAAPPQRRGPRRGHHGRACATTCSPRSGVTDDRASTPPCSRSSSARPAAPTSPSSGEELVCQGCGLAYPVRDDIPVLLVDEARKPA